ncbi:MAG: ATPase, T2SS/T4P/T4SS family [Clostridia bacterium]|nr:ATPase, T2SS/T4P/T4SS family [Clostridia bacterium]MDD4798606.1 ATPase, T2SS/T4P/T4SS family [Clostridia bacterium]
MKNIQAVKNIPIGELLKNYGYITEEQLSAALEYQKQNRSKRLGDILIELGFVTEYQKLLALGQKLDIPVIKLNSTAADLNTVKKIPKALALKYNLIALREDQGSLVVAINDPLNFFAIENIRQATKMPLEICLAESKQISDALEYYYSELDAKEAASVAKNTIAPISLSPDIIDDAAGTEAPVVKLLNSLLTRGYNTNASDIHIEPFADIINIRVRVDGTIVDYMTLSPNVHQPLIARIKILSNLNIAEKRVPQDGHFRTNIEGADINVRVSLIPTIYGEKAVLRLLLLNTKIDHSNSFGMLSQNYQKMLQALQSPHGIVYLTGPTGSGKTTTLYMILEYLANRNVNIVTVEDPVERNLARISQVQVNPAAGLTFESGLRSILRQDPDIIMVGETRDAETASISVRAAITGHLVLSTLHTNDAASSIIRLIDMGIPSYIIASSLVAIVAQRLVRKVCDNCAYEYEPDETERLALGVPVEKLRRGKGCHICNNTGYKGRMAVHEILLIDFKLRNMITARASNEEIFEYAKQQGMTTLRQAAIDLVLNGTTTVEELLKTAYYEGA